MSNTFITVIAVTAAALIFFVVPIMAIANQNDNITQTSVQAIVSDFVNTAAKEGKITKENYSNFLQKLQTTGNTYAVEVEVQIMGDNPGAKGEKRDAIGENNYYSEFTNTIEKALEDSGAYNLKQGDFVKASIENTNVTFGTKLKNIIYVITGNDTIAVAAEASALVTTTGK